MPSLDISPIRPQGELTVTLRLDVRHCLVVGGNEVAAARVRVLLAAGAQVKVVSPELGPELRRRVAWGEVAWSERLFRAEDLVDMSLVLVAIDDPDTSRGIVDLARRAGVLVNVNRAPHLSDFFLPFARLAG